DSAPPPHFAAHPDLCTTIHLQHWLGQVAHKVVWAVAVRRAGKLCGNGRDEGILLLRHPHPYGLGHARGPLTRHDDQPAHLRLRTAEQGLGTPHPLALELTPHRERLMPFFRLPPVPRPHRPRTLPVGLC